MKIRLILLVIASFAAYLVLASFNSKIARKAETHKDQAQIAMSQPHTGKQLANPVPAVVAPQLPKPPQPQAPAASPAMEKLQQLQDELTRKDQQIKQLVEAQESVAARKCPRCDERAESAESADNLLAEKTKQIETLTAEKEQISTELGRTKALSDELRQQCRQQQMSSTATGEQLQQQTDLSDQLKVQVAETSATLAATKKDLEQAEQKAEALTGLNAEKERQIDALNGQKAAMTQTLAEQQEAFARMHREAGEKIEQLNNQLAAISAKDTQAAKELEQCAVDADNARRQAAELAAARDEAQTAQTETEQRLAAVLASKGAVVAQLEEQAAALDNALATGNELKAEITSLRDEKIGLISQLEALLADNNSLLAIKRSCAEQAATLAKAEDKLKAMAALQAKNEELNNSLAEKDTALARAAKETEALTAIKTQLDETVKQIETNGATIKQLQQEKADLAGQLAAAQTLAQNVGGLEKTVSEKNNALALAEVKIKELASIKEQLTTFQAQVAAAQAAQLTAEKSMADNEASLQRCNESLSRGNNKLKQLEGEAGQQNLIPALKQQIQELQQELAASQARVNDLQKQVETAPLPDGQMEAAGKQAAGTKASEDPATDVAKLCPGVPAGVPVDVLGCPQGKGIILKGVGFASKTAALTPESLRELDRIAAALASVPPAKLEVAGYTDNIGDAKRNQKLSTQRAQAVVTYLTGKGIAATRLNAKGYGAENPIGDNTTAEGRQKNRRIELQVVAP